MGPSDRNPVTLAESSRLRLFVLRSYQPGWPDIQTGQHRGRIEFLAGLHVYCQLAKQGSGRHHSSRQGRVESRHTRQLALGGLHRYFGPFGQVQGRRIVRVYVDPLLALDTVALPP